MEVITDVLWIVDNLLANVASFGIITAAIAYYTLFDPRATTAGRMVFRFMVSLAGVIALSLVAEAFGATKDTTWWVALAMIVYGYLVYTIIALLTFMVIRKWKPSRVKKKADLNLMKPRTDTTEIKTIPKK
ncbi:hypothetical protein PBI_CAMILLE_5 [Microbacterium phage Camille]|nr:hypothetical protein PBI_CAMILLE_5 [Microbacterium phage Camille]